MAFHHDPREVTRELIDAYHSTNSTSIDVLLANPTAIQFLGYLAKNRPFVVRGSCRDWPAVQKWDVRYLTKMMGDTEIEVAETPCG